MADQKDFELGDEIELKDKDTGFHDAETGLKLVRSQTAVLERKIGTKTRTALLSGALLVVRTAKKDEPSTPPDDYDIPQDLPGREAFVAAGFTTFAAIKELDTDEKLMAVNGIGKGTVKKLVEWAAAYATATEEK